MFTESLEDPGFPGSPGNSGSRSDPELRVPGVTRNSWFPELPGTSCSRCHPEDCVFPQAPGNPRSRFHPELLFLESYGVFPFPRIHSDLFPFPDSLGTPSNPGHPVLRVPCVFRNSGSSLPCGNPCSRVTHNPFVGVICNPGSRDHPAPRVAGITRHFGFPESSRTPGPG